MKERREGYSLRLSRIPAAMRPDRSPATGAGAWVKAGTGVSPAGAAVAAAGVPLWSPEGVGTGERVGVLLCAAAVGSGVAFSMAAAPSFS